MRARKTLMIQVQLDDKEAATCPIHVLRRRLKGTGIEVDRCYAPVRVAPGRFVGRGLATARAARKARGRPGVVVFGEIRLG